MTGSGARSCPRPSTTNQERCGRRPGYLFGRAIDGEKVLDHEIDNGHGPAKYLTASLVKRVAAALARVTADSLRRPFDPAAMRRADVYPGDWSVIGFDYAWRHFQNLQGCYARAAAAGRAVLVWKG
jgi:Domain of unknown function (DUF1877)